MKKRLAVLHTSFVFIQVEKVFDALFDELIPDVEVIDFVDSSILADVRAYTRINESHVKRMVYLAKCAEEAGSNLIFSACSSLGPAIDIARQEVKVPILKIDDAMTKLAVEKGSRIGVMATVPTTLPPTVDLLKHWASVANKEIVTKEALCKGAFEMLMSGNKEGHDQLVLDYARKIAKDVDVVVLAQASMSRLAPYLSEQIGLDVLGSPRLAVEEIRKMLK